MFQFSIEYFFMTEYFYSKKLSNISFKYYFRRRYVLGSALKVLLKEPEERNTRETNPLILFQQ